LSNETAVQLAGASIRGKLAHHFPECAAASLLVERMTPAGLDLFVSASTDPECGPMLTLGFGGILLETIRDVVAVPLPSRMGEVAVLLRESAVGRFLDSASGTTFGGISPVAAFAERVGDLYTATASRLTLIELNPVRLVSGSARPLILDALVATKGGAV
jgi:hypothetical protein